MEDPLGGPVGTQTKTTFKMATQRNEQDRNTDPEARNRNQQPQDKAGRPEANDKNRVGGDAARTQARRPQDEENTRNQRPTDKTNRPR